jgi:hypothetical protein
MSQIKSKALTRANKQLHTNYRDRAANSSSRHDDCELLAPRPNKQQKKTMTAIETDLQVKSE